MHVFSSKLRNTSENRAEDMRTSGNQGIRPSPPPLHVILRSTDSKFADLTSISVVLYTTSSVGSILQ